MRKSSSPQYALYTCYSGGIAGSGATRPDARPKERAAAYVKGRDLPSLERQIHASTRRSGPNDGELPVYSDLQPSKAGLASLMRAAATGEFNCVVVESVDRLSRDISTLSAIVAQLESYGVEVRTADGSYAFATASAGLTGRHHRSLKRKRRN